MTRRGFFPLLLVPALLAASGAAQAEGNRKATGHARQDAVTKATPAAWSNSKSMAQGSDLGRKGTTPSAPAKGKPG